MYFCNFTAYNVSLKSYADRFIGFTTIAFLYYVEKLRLTVETTLLILISKYLRD